MVVGRATITLPETWGSFFTRTILYVTSGHLKDNHLVKQGYLSFENLPRTTRLPLINTTNVEEGYLGPVSLRHLGGKIENKIV
jgi:hypothetical protein